MSEQIQIIQNNIASESIDSNKSKEKKHWKPKYHKHLDAQKSSESSSSPVMESAEDSQSISTHSEKKPKDKFKHPKFVKNHHKDPKPELVAAIDSNGKKILIQKPVEFIEAIGVDGKKVLIQKNSIGLPSKELNSTEAIDSSKPAKKERTPEEIERYTNSINRAIDVIAQETLAQVSESEFESFKNEYEQTDNINRNVIINFSDDKLEFGDKFSWSRSQFFEKNPKFQDILRKKFQERLPFVWVLFVGKGKKDNSCVIRLVKNNKK